MFPVEEAVCGAIHPTHPYNRTCDLVHGHDGPHRRFSPTGLPDTVWSDTPPEPKKEPSAFGNAEFCVRCNSTWPLSYGLQVCKDCATTLEIKEALYFATYKSKGGTKRIYDEDSS